MSEIVRVRCTPYPTHDDTFSTQVGVVTKAGENQGYLVRREGIDFENNTVGAWLRGVDEKRKEATIAVSCKYPTPDIVVPLESITRKEAQDDVGS